MRTEDGQFSVVSELASIDLGDPRRNRRARRIMARIEQQPASPFPRSMATEADTEGFYRFVRNEAVTFEALKQPHIVATVERARAQEEVLAVHDTTECRYRGANRQGLGRLGTSGQGFFAHCSLAVTADGRRDAIGTLAVETWARKGPTPTALLREGKVTQRELQALPSEQDRWLRGVEAAETAVSGAASVIHVMDSEADDYALMAALVERSFRWVIRLCYDRALADVEQGPAKVKELVAQREVVATRTIDVARRQRAPGGMKTRRARARDARTATLAISATPAVFRRPSTSKHAAASVAVNIVAVREVDPPADVEPIEWLIITTEPIDTQEQILRIVDFYRGRWIIEEFFKALKTGCALETRQLESWHTLMNTLALLLPVAWRLLHLRTLSRDRGEQPARVALTGLEIEVLRHATTIKLPAEPTVTDVLRAVARLGGHLRSNGAPGWQVLGRGFQDLLMMVAGFKLATAARCDQS